MQWILSWLILTDRVDNGISKVKYNSKQVILQLLNIYKLIMLTEEEIKEIQEEIKQYPYPAVACIDALKIVQHHRGWVSDESVKDIAQILEYIK